MNALVLAVVALPLTMGPGAASHAQAAVAPAPPVVQPSPAARPADVHSQDAIIAALYDVISGPGGQKRDWDRFRSLFAAGARLIPTGHRPDGAVTIRVMTPDEYASGVGPRLEASGFFEREVARTSEAFGDIVQAFSTYESRHAAGDAQPFARGINSIQLVHDGTRWWVMTVLWDSERPDNPIPAKYRGKGGS